MDLSTILKRLKESGIVNRWPKLAGSREPDENIEALTSFWDKRLSRRDFVKYTGATVALAGLVACRKPFQPIIPYSATPEDLVPGKPLFFASALGLGSTARGVLVESHEGRPTKVEGNPLHPDSLGGTDIWMQASILSLYDPDRNGLVLDRQLPSTWEAFLAKLRSVLAKQRTRNGAGIRLLTETVYSPFLAHQIRSFLRQFPEARWHQYSPVSRWNSLNGTRLAFNRIVQPVYDFTKADVVLSLEADFLYDGPGHLRHARHFIDGRRLTGGRRNMNRLYVVENTPSVTGSVADNRLALPAREVPAFAAALGRQLGLNTPGPESAAPPEWLAAIAADLKKHRGRSVIVVGESQPATVHALACLLNDSLSNQEQTIKYTEPVEPEPSDPIQSIKSLAEDIDSGRVDALIIVGGNPVYTTPADVPLEDLLPKITFTAHMGQFANETSSLCQWYIPEAHELEQWSDVRAADGTVSIVQPLIAPLHGGKSTHELLAVMTNSAASAYDGLRNYWRERHSPINFESFWRETVHDGVMKGTSLPTTPVQAQRTAVRIENANREGLELTFRSDPNVGDGRFATNGWLQELPKPLTTLTWDNAALVSPSLAKRLELSSQDIVELKTGTRSVEAPVWLMPGQAENTVTVHFGYGRVKSGQAGSSIGFNAYHLRTAENPWSLEDLAVKKIGRKHELAPTQTHRNSEDPHPVRSGTLSTYRIRADFAKDSHELSGQILNTFKSTSDYAWGMTIDLTACIGCNACVTACQSENNIPIVGKDQVRRGREMHWLRIDRYFNGNPVDGEFSHQPILCMHCENAPCEPVCPVTATSHSDEGLNQMTYNRCVGTRYCSNNCPYKVRRFNFYQYADEKTPTLKLSRNPNVTVRTRGVMEKCTYCVQRINAARIKAKRERRTVRDGEVETACQAACPTKAITFGNLRDKASAVSRLKAESLDYGLLTQLNTRPRTTYLARVRNPHPDL